MQTFLAFLLVWDESKSVLENLQACFRLNAQLLDNKRTGKQRVEAKQLLDILLGRNPDSSWHRHPVIPMWTPWVEALKLYYNCFLEEWMARGFVNNLLLEKIDLEALETQGVPPFLTNKHFIDRHRANLMTKHPDFYKQYGWDVEPRTAYYWYLDGAYVLTKYSKRYELDLTGDQAPADPEPPVKKRRTRKPKKEEDEGEKEKEEEEGEEEEEKQKKKKASNKRKARKKVEPKKEEREEDKGRDDDDDFAPPKIKKRRRQSEVELEKKDDQNDEGQGKDVDEEEEEEEEEADPEAEMEVVVNNTEVQEDKSKNNTAKRKNDLSALVSSFAFAGRNNSLSSRRASKPADPTPTTEPSPSTTKDRRIGDQWADFSKI